MFVQLDVKSDIVVYMFGSFIFFLSVILRSESPFAIIMLYIYEVLFFPQTFKPVSDYGFLKKPKHVTRLYCLKIQLLPTIDAFFRSK